MDAKLDNIAKAIEELGTHNILYDILTTLPAAILAAVAAIVAAGATVYFQNQSLKKNVDKAISFEIAAITREISRIVDLPNRNADLECEVVKMRSESIPVFFGNSQHVSLLCSARAQKIFEFYIMFLTIPMNTDTGKFQREDLKVLVSKGNLINEGAV